MSQNVVSCLCAQSTVIKEHDGGDHLPH